MWQIQRLNRDRWPTVWECASWIGGINVPTEMWNYSTKGEAMVDLESLLEDLDMEQVSYDRSDYRVVKLKITNMEDY